jgi:hypothetical protein
MTSAIPRELDVRFDARIVVWKSFPVLVSLTAVVRTLWVRRAGA